MGTAAADSDLHCLSSGEGERNKEVEQPSRRNTVYHSQKPAMAFLTFIAEAGHVSAGEDPR